MGMSPATMYLVLYNLSCCLGWAVVLSTGLQIVSSAVSGGSSIGDALASVYDKETIVPDVLFYVQSAALLEIMHAAVGLVRSPVFVTTMQVGSRIAALFAIINAPTSQGKLIIQVYKWRVLYFQI